MEYKRNWPHIYDIYHCVAIFHCEYHRSDGSAQGHQTGIKPPPYSPGSVLAFTLIGNRKTVAPLLGWNG